jgi:hypothetical protein
MTDTPSAALCLVSGEPDLVKFSGSARIFFFLLICFKFIVIIKKLIIFNKYYEILNTMNEWILSLNNEK